jgi:hypothetical protein
MNPYFLARGRMEENNNQVNSSYLANVEKDS